ncbi:MAG: Nickel uptake substrate-specific transmembrane region [Candidatus Bathyarchaeota archaeon BA1]|nr:MAG: Nickel uptake substrate-specific transmembrane region [Candidatus Bathyarchaeota archaeon BA1]
MRLSRVQCVSLILIVLASLIARLSIPASSENAWVQVKIRTINLNKEPIANMTVEVYNATKDPEAFIMREKTNQTGWVEFELPNGTHYSFKAFWKDVQVGSLPKRHITSNVTIGNFSCSLAHVKVLVTDERNAPLPYIDITLTYNYSTKNKEKRSEETSFISNETGTIVAPNMLINASYAIEARRYGFLFNRTLVPDLNQLLKGGWVNITITCPTYTLFIHVVDSVKLPIPRAQVQVFEWNGNVLTQSGNTNDRGSITFNCTFGKYKIRVHGYSTELKSRLLLNETFVNLIEDRLFFLINCKILNVAPSVVVIDYFGQPIPNAMVEVERKVEQRWVKIEPPRKTDAYGTASLPKIGGDYRISVYVMGELYGTRTLYLDETKVVMFKMDTYIMVGGHPLKTSQLITYVLLSLLITFSGLALGYKGLIKTIMRKKTVS